MIKAILFDLDGVLLDTEYYTLSIKIELLKEYSVEMDDEFIEKMCGRKFSDFVKEKLAYLPNLAEITETYQTRAYQHIDYHKLEKENASYVLRKLKEKYILGLVTASDRQKIQRVFQELNWEDIFDVVVDHDFQFKSKPHPDCYNQAVKTLELNKEQCLVIEDSTTGILAAKRAGLKVVALKDDRLKVDQSLADYQIDNLIQLLMMMEV
ncbi:MAG: HAD family hydrolase [Erysipelotrichaceae bacterium]